MEEGRLEPALKVSLSMDSIDKERTVQRSLHNFIYNELAGRETLRILNNLTEGQSETAMNNYFEVKEISNYYGTLEVKAEEGKYYWGILDWNDVIEWSEIPKALYDELCKRGKQKEY